MTTTSPQGREALNHDSVLPWLTHCIEGIGRVAAGAEKVFLVPGLDSFDDGFAVIETDATWALGDLQRVFGERYPALFANIDIPPEVSLITQQKPAR